MIIINLTQHKATPEQIVQGVIELPRDLAERARELLTFIDLPSVNEINDRAEALAYIAMQANDYQDLDAPSLQAAMIGGAPYLMSALERELLAVGIMPVYSFSQRESREAVLDDGTVHKFSVFNHVGFVGL